MQISMKMKTADTPRLHSGVNTGGYNRQGARLDQVQLTSEVDYLRQQGSGATVFRRTSG